LTKLLEYVQPGPRWVEFCKACQLLADLRTAATNVPSSVILLLARLGDLDTAASYVTLDPDSVSKSWLLTELAGFYVKREQRVRARDCLNLAEAELTRV